MKKATIIRTDGTEQVLDHRPSLEEAQAIVGGYIELLPANICTKGKVLVVDDEGRLKNKLFNQKGSQLYGRPIVGDIIVLEGWRTVGQ